MAPGNLEIARSAALKPIEDIANEMGLGQPPAGTIRP